MSWRFLVDRGGTFTDVVAVHDDGRVKVGKWLSRSPEYADPAVAALAAYEAEAGAGSVSELRMGTTVATNALLERTGERVLLLTTKGFADLLEIGFQDRPDLFALQIEKRGLLHAEVVEIDERVRADGTRERPLDEDAVAAAVTGHDCVAVLFLNAWAHPEHERRAGEIARAAGCSHVALSHEVAREIGAVSRGDTTVADAYLTPLLRRSIEGVLAPDRSVLFMQSSGGLTDARHFSGKDAILSGPAGGVVAVTRIAERSGHPKVIGLDMGGTSTDVCRCDGEPERTYETVTAGVRIRAPMLDIVTVAAGGGSILSERDGRFRVGPESAGADPGPAAYGRGGPATLTDANVVLGRILPDFFPHLALDVEAARERLAALGDPEQAAAGFVRIANENMAAAIRRISTARGYDVREYALCGFGGAAGQHVCALADLLEMPRVILHPLAGVMSAWGMGLADVTHDAVAPVLDPRMDTTVEPPPFPVDEAVAPLREQGHEDIDVVRTVDARYAGTDDVLNVPWSETEGGTSWRQAFIERHRTAYGFIKPEHPIELVAARVTAVGRTRDRTGGLEDPAQPVAPHRPEPLARGGAGALGADVYRREALEPGASLDGPAILVEDQTTTVIEPGWRCTVDGRRQLVLERVAATRPRTGPRITAVRDPVSLEIMANRFMSLAWQMGEHLRRVAHSTNIKERLDFSCALFAPDGGLVSNAPHIPVHLGAMSETVRCLLDAQEMRSGDTWLTNDPSHGGSHLPDLTVITPVFRDGALAFLVANRGHHADVGGPTPGSMPIDSTCIEDEGCLFTDFLLVRDEGFRSDALTAHMERAGVREIPERIADLVAQTACNARGAALLHELCDEYGTGVVQAWMGHVKDNAAEVMRDVVDGLSGGSFEDRLDDGSVIRVAISVDGGRAKVDFTGTSPQHPGNRNAPRAVTVAAVLYVFRTLARRPIPLNSGCLEPLEIVVPRGCMLDPRPGAAVVAGNVETSQRIVDVLYGALGTLAAAQGTMNNVTFGDETFGYYETICGGAGAGFGFDGASAVHTHMTNTRITDPEVLERRYPVVVREFSVRRGSGGKGTWNGGDGVVRHLEFLRPLKVSVLAERRKTAPFGIRAGDGARGEHEITPTSLIVRTPGGGGYSPTPEEWASLSVQDRQRLAREGRPLPQP